MEEPLLELDEIQGNIVPGFGSAHQLLLVTQVVDAAKARQAIGRLSKEVSSTRKVLDAKRDHQSVRFFNIGFSLDGIRVVFGDDIATELAGLDDGFRVGLSGRSFSLGDTRERFTADGDPNPGHRDNWVVGAPDADPQVIFVLGSRTASDLEVAEEWLANSIEGMKILYPARGTALSDSKEHFGFRDDISHPGVRGRISDSEYLTPRTLEPGSEDGPEFAKPGQPLVWPGQFVFGYPTQQITNSRQPGIPPSIPNFARNGSFLVFRRLNQHVEEFYRDTDEIAEELRDCEHLPRLDGDLFRAKIVGRWPSGAPIARYPDSDPGIAGNDPAINHFGFRLPTPDVRFVSGEEVTGISSADDSGLVCPKFAHVRKVNPRDATHDAGGGESGTLTKRILRRGIPFGPTFNHEEEADPRNSEERGLLFISYQTSIERQFEFLSHTWMNNPAAPEDEQPGHDILVGQNGTNSSRERAAALVTTEGRCPFKSLNQWVVPTGGGYFFVPSISQLANLLPVKLA